MAPQTLDPTPWKPWTLSPKTSTRFMSAHSEHSDMTPADYEDVLRVGGQVKTWGIGSRGRDADRLQRYAAHDMWGARFDHLTVRMSRNL